MEDNMTRQQAIAYLGIDPSTLFRWERSGKIKRKGGIGNKVYYSRAAIDKAITKNS